MIFAHVKQIKDSIAVTIFEEGLYPIVGIICILAEWMDAYKMFHIINIFLPTRKKIALIRYEFKSAKFEVL